MGGWFSTFSRDQRSHGQMFALDTEGNPVANTQRTSLSLVNLVKDMVKHTLPSEMQETALIVQEVQCFEPGCAPIETFVAVLGEAPRRFQTKILLPLKEVVQADVTAAMPAKAAWATGKAPSMPDPLHKGASSDDKATVQAGMEALIVSGSTKDRHGFEIGCSCCIGPPDTAFEDACEEIKVSCLIF